MLCHPSAHSWPRSSTTHTPAIADVKTTRNEAVWNQEDGYLGPSDADPEPIPLDIGRNGIRSYGAYSSAQ
jgi:hypothetical protein